MEQNQEKSLFDTNMDSITQGHLQSISKWTRFISIAGFVAMGLMVILLAILGNKLADQLSAIYSLNESGLAGAMIAIVIIALLIAALWIYFLFKASNLLRNGLQQRDSAMLADGFRALKTYFIFSFVFSVLGILSTFQNMF